MTTPLSEMVALLIPNTLISKRGRESARRLSEVGKGVTEVYGGRLSTRVAYGKERGFWDVD